MNTTPVTINGQVLYTRVSDPKEPSDVLLVQDVGRGVGFLVQTASGKEIFLSDDMLEYLNAARVAEGRK